MSIFKLDLNIKKHIPNAITCCNLICGCLAIVQIFEGNLVMAAYLVGLAAIFDFFDGFAARLLKVSSPIGKDLDSLADMVTFGVVPGFMMFKMLLFMVHVKIIGKGNFEWSETGALPLYYPYVAFLIPVFSALRLAKFNNDTRQTDSFIGLPTPANSIFICSIPLIVDWTTGFSVESLKIGMNMFMLNPFLLIAVTVIFSLMLIVELPLIALKFKSFGWKGNEVRYILIILSVLLVISLKLIGIPLAILAYVLISGINNEVVKAKAGKTE